MIVYHSIKVFSFIHKIAILFSCLTSYFTSQTQTYSNLHLISYWMSFSFKYLSFNFCLNYSQLSMYRDLIHKMAEQIMTHYCSNLYSYLYHWQLILTDPIGNYTNDYYVKFITFNYFCYCCLTYFLNIVYRNLHHIHHHLNLRYHDSSNYQQSIYSLLYQCHSNSWMQHCFITFKLESRKHHTCYKNQILILICWHSLHPWYLLYLEWSYSNNIVTYHLPNYSYSLDLKYNGLSWSHI
jgi:hypothetical protein